MSDYPKRRVTVDGKVVMIKGDWHKAMGQDGTPNSLAHPHTTVEMVHIDGKWYELQPEETPIPPDDDKTGEEGHGV